MTTDEVTCEQVRDAFRAGLVPRDPAVTEHIRACPSCAELYAGRPPLGLSLASSSDSLQPPQELWNAIDDAVGREVGARAWLRSRPTRTRIALAMAAFAAAALTAALHLRADFAQLSKPLLVAWLLAFVLAGLGAVTLVLAALGWPTVPRLRRGLLAGLALLLPVLYAGSGAQLSSADTDAGASALSCFVYGTLLATPLLVLLWALDRRNVPRLSLSLLGGLAAGLAANAALLLHCAAGDPGHLLFGHAAIGAALAAFAGVATLLVTRRR